MGTSVDGGIRSGPVVAPNNANLVQMKKAVLELETYNFGYPRRGRCIIINNHHFNRMLTKQMDRDGTEVDATAVESLFVSLGFDVVRYDDLTVTEMSINLREVSREDHSDADCFACVILSHGDNGVIYGTNGTMKLDEIVTMFKGDNCTSLAGKPKLFFIQACRGRRYDAGVEIEDTVDAPDHLFPPPEDETDSVSIRRIPVEADILIAYSVVPGYFSWRNNVDGSWFVQALVRVLHEHGDTMEALQMMTLVNKVVAYDFESCTDEEFTSGMKQVPCIVSTLTKLLYFKPKY
jgi:hypothetical protein